MTIIQLYAQSKVGLPFKNYIVDLQRVTMGKLPDTISVYMPCIYVQGGNMIQKLDMMNTQEDQINYIKEIAKPYLIMSWKQSQLGTLFEKYTDQIAKMYLLINNTWFYNEVYSSTKNFNSNPVYDITMKESCHVFTYIFINFVVCDDNWQTKYWIDGVKEYAIMDYLKQCQAWDDSTKIKVYNKIITK